MGEDYSKLEEITVKSQAELDDIPEDFEGNIYIEFGVYWNRAAVTKRYKGSVEARGNSSVVARGNSSVVAWGNSSVEAWENSSVEAWENSSVVAWGNSSVEAWGNSSVEARGNSSVVAWGNSSVEARGNSSVDGSGNAQITDRQVNGRIKLSGNARTVYDPKTIEEYCSFYGIKHTKKKGVFYKAVRKRDGRYFADHRSDFEYIIGKRAKADSLTTDPTEACGYGIHISHMAWAIIYGADWDDLAILEVEASLDGIIVPKNGNGKIRCAEVKVLREVPLEECGLYGKILAKRRAVK